MNGHLSAPLLNETAALIDATVSSLMRLDGQKSAPASGAVVGRPTLIALGKLTLTLVVPRSEKIDVRGSAKAHGVQSSRGSGACDDLHSEPNRHGPNRGVGNVYELMMHPKPEARRVILASALENASHAAGQTAVYLPVTDARRMNRCVLLRCIRCA
jgi:hypothetical protein